MPFADYDSIDAVARRFQIHCRRASFVEPIPARLGDAFRAEQDLTLTEVAFDCSDQATCETLIYPTLREVWKPYHESLTLRSHEPTRWDDALCGVPDYLVARRSPLGSIVFDTPYLFVISQAKRDDFERGWGRCLSAMLAAQRINDLPGPAIHGATTNGTTWQFGRLVADSFSLELTPFTLRDTSRLAAALIFMFASTCDEAAKAPSNV
jgi:hypothetical protein